MKLSSPASYLTSPRSCAADLKFIRSFWIFNISTVTKLNMFKHSIVSALKLK